MRRSGITLTELLVCLTFVGLAMLVALGPIRRYSDWIVLRSAREEMISLFHRARMEARLNGSARLVVSESGDPALALAGRPDPVRVELDGRGIELEVSGSRSSVSFDFGPLGIAYFASATLRLHRGGSEVPIVVSGYGRVRR